MRVSQVLYATLISTFTTTSALAHPTLLEARSTCNKFYTVQSGDTCQGIVNLYKGAFTLAQFYSWNPTVNSQCTNLQVGVSYCVGVAATSSSSSKTSSKSTTLTKSSTSIKPTTSTKPTSTTKSSTSSKPTSTSTKSTSTASSKTSSTTTSSTATGIPSPTATGIIANCASYYQVVSGDTCDVIATKLGSKFTTSQFLAWNSAINPQCTNLIPGEYYCTSSKGPACWTGAEFPPIAAWANWTTMWNALQPTMIYGGDQQVETQDISEALQYWAGVGGFDSRFALAIMMHESSGVTTAPCGDQGKSCGVMQVQATVPTCSSHPCSNSTISTMIQCGTVGGCGGVGANIKTCLASYDGSYGEAARCYNTGSVENPADLSVCKYGIRSYVSDIANYLVGQNEGTMVSYESKCYKNNTCSG